MEKGSSLIYQGVLHYQNLLGIPDLLRKVSNGIYLPIDIKSGVGLKGINDEGDGGKPKKHYAVQLCLYNDILKKLNFASEHRSIIIDINFNEVEYGLDNPQSERNPVTWFDIYRNIKQEVKLLIENKVQNKPALSSICRLCPWYSSCRKWCEDCKDLTNIFYLGRNKRDTINKDLSIERTDQMCSCDIDSALEQKKKDKSFLKGVGEKTLSKIIDRARVINILKKPVIYKLIEFPKVSKELFFDIEADPTQDFIYLHGIYERSIKGEEKYISFLAKDNKPKEEIKAWENFWKYIWSLPENDYSVYYYSSYEKSVYRRLSKKYPDVVLEEKLEAFFSQDNTIDLYLDVILKYTDWPVFSYSLKDIATYLGFEWRDDSPSGALSIQWYNEYLVTKDENILKRILEYNEDDCKALMVLKDSIEKLEVEDY
jgi:predicted RecB family nuclease